MLPSCGFSNGCMGTRGLSCSVRTGGVESWNGLHLQLAMARFQLVPSIPFLFVPCCWLVVLAFAVSESFSVAAEKFRTAGALFRIKMYRTYLEDDQIAVGRKYVLYYVVYIFQCGKLPTLLSM